MAGGGYAIAHFFTPETLATLQVDDELPEITRRSDSSASCERESFEKHEDEQSWYAHLFWSNTPTIMRGVYDIRAF